MSRLAQAWSAVRYRRTQSLVLCVVSALVTTCAVFAPLFVRTLEQGLLQAGLIARDVADTTVVVRAVRTTAEPDTTPDDLTAVMPEAAGRWFHDGVGMTTADTRVQPRAGLQTSPLRLVARDDICAHVELSVGRCPETAGEVLVSGADAAAWGWGPGRQFEVVDPSARPPVPGTPPAPVALTVVGVYASSPHPDYWLRTRLDGKSGFPLGQGDSIVPAVDDFVTSEGTFASGWSEASASVEFPLDRSAVTLSTLPVIRDSLEGIGGASESVTVSTPVPDLVATVVAGRSIVRTLVPLLLAQLALLAVTVLALMAHAAVEQRRPEIALARLRGRSRDGGGRVVMSELSLTVLLGAPLGITLALVVGDVLRRTVTPAGVPFELRWPVAAAAVLAVLGSLLAVYTVSRPVLREPVGALLRRVPPRASRGLGLLDVVAAGAGERAARHRPRGAVARPAAGAAARPRRRHGRVRPGDLRGQRRARRSAQPHRPGRARDGGAGRHHDRRDLAGRPGRRRRRTRGGPPPGGDARRPHPPPGPQRGGHPARPPRGAGPHRVCRADGRARRAHPLRGAERAARGRGDHGHPDVGARRVPHG